MVRLPGRVLQSRSEAEVAVVASPLLRIRPSFAKSSVTMELAAGSFVRSLDEADLRASTKLHIVLHGDTFSADLGQDTPATAALLGALRSQQDEQGVGERAG